MIDSIRTDFNKSHLIKQRSRLSPDLFPKLKELLVSDSKKKSNVTGF